VALIVPEKERASAVSFVFLGWSVATACGLPLVTVVAAHFGWRAVFIVAALLSLTSCILLALTLPRDLRGRPLSLDSFVTIARDRYILLLLAITILQTSGQFTVFVYLAPLLERLAHVGPEVIGPIFALYGVCSFVGNVIATRIVMRLGTWTTSGIFLASTVTGLMLCAIGVDWLPLFGAGILFWGLGFAATNSMQQARLVEAAPALSSATVGLNTSSLYVGQAGGSALGGFLFSHGYLSAIGYAGAAFVAAAIAVWLLTRQLRPVPV
jgi:DHA1 family inner membrane transport protein